MKYIGMLIGIVAMVLAFIWFGWKLVVVLLLAMWGNNIERFAQINEIFKRKE